MLTMLWFGGFAFACVAVLAFRACSARPGADRRGSPRDCRRTAERCLCVLRACRTRRDVLNALAGVANLDTATAPAALRAKAVLEADSTLDALRVRDDYVRVYAAFVASLRAF